MLLGYSATCWPDRHWGWKSGSSLLPPVGHWTFVLASECPWALGSSQIRSGFKSALLSAMLDMASLALGQYLGSKPGLGLVTWVGSHIGQSPRIAVNGCAVSTLFCLGDITPTVPYENGTS